MGILHRLILMEFAFEKAVIEGESNGTRDEMEIVASDQVQSRLQLACAKFTRQIYHSTVVGFK